MRKILKFCSVTLLILAFFLLVLPYMSPRFRGLLNNYITPVLPAFGKLFYSESKVLSENERLRREIESLRAKEDYWDALFEENQRLRNQAGLNPTPQYDTVVASIIVRNPLTGKYRFIIDKGSDAGLTIGMPVMAGQNMLGRIVEVNKHDAVVGTLAMKNVSVFCRIKGTPFHGKLSEEADISDNTRLYCTLTWLPRDADITRNMVVLSSGFSSDEDHHHASSSLIPPDLTIGKVVQVSKNEKFQEAIVELSAPWVGFERVTILKKQKNP